jgi:hypothetical protein
MQKKKTKQKFNSYLNVFIDNNHNVSGIFWRYYDKTEFFMFPIFYFIFPVYYFSILP